MSLRGAESLFPSPSGENAWTIVQGLSTKADSVAVADVAVEIIVAVEIVPSRSTCPNALHLYVLATAFRAPVCQLGKYRRNEQVGSHFRSEFQ